MRLNLIKPVQTQIDLITIVDGRPLYLEAREPDNTDLKKRIVGAIEREFAPNQGLRVLNPDDSGN